MNDTTQTPTDQPSELQPSELDAIRASLAEIEKRYSKEYRLKFEGTFHIPIYRVIYISHRLLELLDEREKTFNWNELWATNEIDSLRHELAKRDSELSNQWNAVIADQKATIESLRRELAEAREKAIEEAALVAENFPESKSEGCAEAIRSLKPQPNQAVVTSPALQLKKARELMREWWREEIY